MSFGAELKDFTSGFQAGFSMRDKAKDRKQERDLYDARARGMTLGDTEEFNKTKFGEGAQTSLDTPREPSATGGGAPPTDAKGAGKERYDYLVGTLKVPPALASGIIGNAYAESRFQPTGAEGDKGTAHGEFQWRGDRWANMQRFAAQNKMDPKDWKTQYAFMWHETQQLPQYKQLLAAKDPSHAADMFALYFERPKGAETGDPNKIHNIGGRRSYAQGFSYGMPDTSPTAIASAWNQGDKPTQVAAATPSSALPTTSSDAAAEPAQPEIQTIDWDTENTGLDEDEEQPTGYAEGGTVDPNYGAPRAFTQPVGGDAAGAPATAIPLPRQIDFAAAQKPIVNPSAGIQQRFRDKMAASAERLKAASAAPATTQPGVPVFNGDPNAYLAAQRENLAQQRSRFAAANRYTPDRDSQHFPRPQPQFQAQPFMSYQEWSSQQPGYAEWYKQNYPQGTAPAPPAAPARRFAAGGAVEKEDKKKPKPEAIPFGTFVSPKDYGKLDPGAGPINEGTASQWRLDAQAQTRARARLEARDKEYHSAKPAAATGGEPASQPTRKTKHISVTRPPPVGTGGGMGTPGGKPGELGTPNEATMSPEGPAPGTPGGMGTAGGKPGELGTPVTGAAPAAPTVPPPEAIPTTRPQDAPQPDTRPQSGPTSGRGATKTIMVPGPRGGLIPKEVRNEPPPTPQHTPEYGPGGPGGYTPPAPDNRVPPQRVDRAGNPTGPAPAPEPPAAPTGAVYDELGNLAIPPEAPPPAPPAPPPVPTPATGHVASAIPAGPATPSPAPPIQPPAQTSGPSPVPGHVAQAIPAGPATPAVQPPEIRRTDQPPASAAPVRDTSPEPWLPQNVPEEAKGTLSQAWQYGRAMLQATPDQRPAAENLFNSTLVQAMKLGTPHSVISAYADNFGTVAPPRPKQAIGMAAGGAVPDDEEESPANLQAAAAEQPVIPPGGQNLRAATPEVEAKAKGRPIVAREEIKESTKAGLKYINDNILSPQPRAALQDPAQGDAQQKFDTNDHALTSQEMAQLGKQVDPEDKLAPAQKILKAQSDMYDFYMAHGYPEKAAGAAASVMLYGRRVSQISGTMAQAALESGRPDALQQAAKFMAKAYDTMPNGHELKVESQPGPDGKLGYEVVDEDGNTVEQGRAGAEEMMGMAKKMASGQAWAAETFRLAQETGLDASGKKGRGRSTGPTYTERSTEERKSLSKAAAEAGKAFKADPSDENRQRYEDAKAAALSGGVSGGAISSLDKIYAPAEKQPGTAGERADLEADKALEVSLGNIDKQIQSEQDPAKQLELKKQKVLLPLDDAYNRAVKKSRIRVDSKGIDEALDTAGVEGPDRDAATRFAKDFQRANNFAIGDAVGIIKMAMDPNETFRLNGNQVMIGDQSYFLSGPLYRGLMGIRNAKKKPAAPAEGAPPAQAAAG